MASLVGGVAGAAIGFSLGGPLGAQIGFAIGSYVGGTLAAKDVEGPRLEERDVQVSSLGAPIAVSYGTWRHTGNVIWPKDFQMDERSETESAKGGPEQTTYTYSATFAVLLCKGPKAGIGRIWANKKLIVDGSERDPCVSGLRFMLGGEDQEPDPLMVARDGSAPAYRDSCIIIFEDLDCTDFGNRPPVIEAEVFSVAETSGPPEPRVSYDGDSAPVATVVSALGLVDPETGYIWSTSPKNAFGSSVDTYITDDESQTLLDSISTPSASNVVNTIVYVPAGATGREIWVMGWVFVAQDYAWIYNADTLALVDAVDLGYRGTFKLNAAAYDPVTQKVITIGFGGGCRVIDPLTRTVESGFSLGAYGTAYISCIIVTTDYLAVFSYGSYDKLTLLNLADYSVARVIDNPYAGLPYSGFSYDPEREKLIHLGVGGGAYNVIDIETGSVSPYTLVAAEDADPDYSGEMAAVVYCAYNDRYIFAATALSGLKTTLNVVNPDSLAVESTYTYEDYDAAHDPLILPPLLIPKDDPPYILAFDETRIKRMYLGSSITGGPVTLASIVSDICIRDPDGLADADIDVSELEEDLVDGYCIAQQMARVAAITPLMATWFFDGLGSEHILKFPKRGHTPAVTIPKAERAAHEAGADAPQDDLKITRAAELELPYRVDVNYISAARDYQVNNQYHNRTTRDANALATLDLSIVLDDSKAKAVAMTTLYHAWLRTSFAFATDNSYAKYEPTDVFTVPTDGVTYTVRAVSRSDQGNGVIAWEGQIEDIAVYDQEGIVPADDFPPQVIRDPGDTILHLLDIPILRDVDDNPGYYVAMAGTTEGWRGAQLFKSVDGGSTYDPMLSVTNEAGIGRAQSALADFTAGNIFDNGNAVTIVLQADGPLISATTDQVLNGSNTAILGAPGRWEVINYKNATLLAPDTYQLSGLLRGRRGTEWATGTHAAGDTFIWARTTTWQRPGASSSEIGLPRLYKAPPFRTRLSEADEQEFTNTAVGLKPYSVVNLEAHRDGADLVIEWDPRSRIGYGPLNAIVPVGEASESYRIQIMDGVTVKRTLTSSTPTVTYTAADQTTDWGGTAGPYVVQVAKMSATVGAGYIEEETFA